MQLSRLVLRLTLGMLISWSPLEVRAADFVDVKGDLKRTIDFLEANACPNPLFSELCTTGRTLRPLLQEQPGPVETVLDTVLQNMRPEEKGKKWETAWADNADLISVPQTFCTELSINEGYCKDFRCFIADKGKHTSSGCPTTPLPANSVSPKTSKEMTLLSSPGFDKICRGNFCFPSDRNKAEARRFMELDAKALADDFGTAAPGSLKERLGSRYRCWVVAEAAVSLAAGLGLSEDDVKGSRDCGTAKALLAKVESAAQLQTGQPTPAAALAAQLPAPVRPVTKEHPNYTVLSSAKDSSALIRGIAIRLDGRNGTAEATATAHILLLIDNAQIPGAVGDTKTPDVQPLDTGISAIVIVGADGTVSIPPGFGKPVLAVDYKRLAATLKGLMPSAQNFSFNADSVILAPKLVPISFNAMVKLPGLGITAELGTIHLDCDLGGCGLSELTDGKALRGRLDQELGKLSRTPAAGSVYLKSLHFCPDEQQTTCVVGTLVAPNLADVFGTADLTVRFYPPPNGRAVLIPNTISEERLASIRDQLIRRLKPLAPDLRESWVAINDPRIALSLDTRGEPRLSWAFTAQAALRLADSSLTFPLEASDKAGLSLDRAVQAVSAQVRDQVAAYAKRVLTEATVTQLDQIKASLLNLKIFGQSSVPERLTCKDNVCSFSLGSWIGDVYASRTPGGAVTMCFANASVGPSMKGWIQSALPHSDGLNITVEKVSIPTTQTGCSLRLPKFSIDLTVGLPPLGMDPQPLTVLIDPNAGNVDAMVPDIVAVLRSQLLNKAATLKSLPFTIDDITGSNPITLKGSFAIPNSGAALLKGKLSADVYPQFRLSLDCPSGDLGAAVGQMLNIPIPIKAEISGCSVFPVHMQVDLTLPVVSTSAKFNIDLAADGRLAISDPVPVPLTPLIPIGSTPFVIRNSQLGLYLKEAGHFVLTGSMGTLATGQQLRVDVAFDANLAEHKLSFKGPLLLVGIPLAQLTGSFDGRELRGDAKLLVLANADSTFLLRADPLTYVQTLDVNVWNQLSLSAALRIESGNGDCGSSGLPSVCLTGKLDLFKVIQGDIVLYVKPQLADFASLKANAKFAGIAGLGLRASPKLLAVKIDAGIVKLSIVLPGVAALTSQRILKEIADALVKIHIDPDAFLKGNWQISLGGQGSGSADGYGESSGGGSPDSTGGADGNGVGGNGAVQGGQTEQTGGQSAGVQSVATPTNGGTGGGSEQEPWTPGNCQIKFAPQPGTDKYLRELACPGVLVIHNSCPWSGTQIGVIKNRSGVLLLPVALNVDGGYAAPEFSFDGAPCWGAQYRVYETAEKGPGDCSSGVCVMQINGPPGSDGARDLGNDALLQKILGTSEKPAAYLTSHKGATFTSPQWRAIYALAKKAWNPAESEIQQLSCYLSVGDRCEMFVIGRAVANSPQYSLIAEDGEVSVPAAAALLQITKVTEFARVANGLVSVFETPLGQMIGWWTFTQPAAAAAIIPTSVYLARRACWQGRQDAPQLANPKHLMTDFSFFDGIATLPWKERGWRKNPLLIFLDSSCK